MDIRAMAKRVAAGDKTVHYVPYQSAETACGKPEKTAQWTSAIRSQVTCPACLKTKPT